MSRRRSVLFSLMGLALTGGASATDVAVCTDRGRAVFELADTAAPQHVANFLRYVDTGYYTGMVFHRVKPNFVVQGGGVDRQLRPRPTLAPVPNESSNGLKNRRGTVAAARTDDPNSATAQFFVNLEDNSSLDAGARPGFTVFARVKDGMSVFESIGHLPTRAAGQFKGEVPNPLVVIRSISRIDDSALAGEPQDAAAAALKARIKAASDAGDSAETLRLAALFRSTCAPDDPEVSLLEAQAAFAANDLRHAAFLLDEYFSTTDPNHPTYEAATALYRKAVPENQRSAATFVSDCTPPTVPTVPDGTRASMEDMVAGQKQVKAFVTAGESYLKCLAKVIDSKDRPVEERNAAVNEHNRMVGTLEQIAAGFNEQIKKFKARG